MYSRSSMDCTLELKCLARVSTPAIALVSNSRPHRTCCKAWRLEMAIAPGMAASASIPCVRRSIRPTGLPLPEQWARLRSPCTTGGDQRLPLLVWSPAVQMSLFVLLLLNQWIRGQKRPNGFTRRCREAKCNSPVLEGRYSEDIVTLLR